MYVCMYVCIYVRSESLNTSVIHVPFRRSCHLSDGWSLPSHHEGPITIAGQAKYDACGGQSRTKQVFLLPRTSIFPLSSSFHQRSTLVFIYMLPSPERQMGEAWEPSKKQCSFGNWGALNGERLSLLSFHYKGSMGRNSSVGIATRYGLDVPGIEFRCRRNFPHPSRLAMGPTYPMGKGKVQGSRGMALLFLTSALDGAGWSTARPGRFTPGKETWYSLYRRLGGSQDRSGRVRKISPPPPGFDLWTVQPVASHYTDYAIPAHDLHNGYRDNPEVKRPGRGVSNLLPSSAKVTGKIELYLYCPSVPQWSLIGRNLPLYLKKSNQLPLLPYKVLSCNFHCCAGQT